MTARELQLLIYKTLLEAHNESMLRGDEMSLTHVENVSCEFAKLTLPYTVCADAEEYLPVISESISIFMDMLCAFLDIPDTQFSEEFQTGYKAGELALNASLPEGSDVYKSSLQIFTMDENGELIEQEADEPLAEGLSAYENLDPIEHLYTQNLLSMVNARMLRIIEETGGSNEVDAGFEVMTECCCQFLVGNLSQKESALSACTFVYEWIFEAESSLTPQESKSYRKKFNSALKKAVADSKKGNQGGSES